jgi:hypothetical protein
LAAAAPRRLRNATALDSGLRRNDCDDNGKGNYVLPAEPTRAQRKATATALDSGLRRNDGNNNGSFTGNSAGFRPAPE